MLSPPAVSAYVPSLSIFTVVLLVIALASILSNPPPFDAPLSSTMLSVPLPEAKRYTSSPPNPVSVSLPRPPVMEFASSLPVILSAPLPPMTFSKTFVAERVRDKFEFSSCAVAVERSIVMTDEMAEKFSVSVPPAVSSMKKLPSEPPLKT